jgi:hypothetical protein
MSRQVLAGLLTLFGFLITAAVPTAQAQTVDCRFFKVTAESLNVFADPRGDATFLGALNRNDFVCVADDQQVGDRKWAFIAYRLLPGNQRKSMDGWGIMTALQPATTAEVAALNQAPAAPPQTAQSIMPPPAVAVAPPPLPAPPPPQTAQSIMPPPAVPVAPPPAPSMPSGVPANAAPPPTSVQPIPQVPGNSAPPPPSAPPSQAMTTPSVAAPPSPMSAPPPPPATYAQPPMQAPAPPPAPSAQAAPFDNEIVRWSQPITSGGYPVQGFSLEELVRGVPEYPPIEGLPEEVWRKTCSNCHQWNQQSLCVQARIYAQDPQMAFRKQHPYGGPEKIAMMKWARQGCL